VALVFAGTLWQVATFLDSRFRALLSGINDEEQQESVVQTGETGLLRCADSTVSFRAKSRNPYGGG